MNGQRFFEIIILFNFPSNNILEYIAIIEKYVNIYVKENEKYIMLLKLIFANYFLKKMIMIT